LAPMLKVVSQVCREHIKEAPAATFPILLKHRPSDMQYTTTQTVNVIVRHPATAVSTPSTEKGKGPLIGARLYEVIVVPCGRGSIPPSGRVRIT
jgi:hypothetical protein